MKKVKKSEKDYFIVRKILKAVEENNDGSEIGLSQEELGLQEIDRSIYLFHTRVLTKEGALESEREVSITEDKPRYSPYALTDLGRELLKEISFEGKMKKVLNFILKTAKDITVAVAVEIAKGNMS